VLRCRVRGSSRRRRKRHFRRSSKAERQTGSTRSAVLFLPTSHSDAYLCSTWNILVMSRVQPRLRTHAKRPGFVEDGPRWPLAALDQRLEILGFSSKAAKMATRVPPTNYTIVRMRRIAGLPICAAVGATQAFGRSSKRVVNSYRLFLSRLRFMSAWMRRRTRYSSSSSHLRPEAPSAESSLTSAEITSSTRFRWNRE
jgi:hypothetical protein